MTMHPPEPLTGQSTTPAGFAFLHDEPRRLSSVCDTPDDDHLQAMDRFLTGRIVALVPVKEDR